ncbi:ABC transporter ATP-binding protein [Cohnella algarum]|uniref:ABC transporter ATP-binding protein n=1 Tax=Cohnella algarum TaxID=2044859 RepID=UPI0019683503|nr:ABC transporter ATP-binding protein [Cohnella algarum]MBN2984574.1 ABC transporter ATP-binding protein [Cohnella algarum]
MSAALTVRGLTYGFAGAPPLFEGLDFEVREGEFVSFVMPSGMGKTTLFRLIAGLLEPHAGAIVLGGASAGRGGIERPEADSGRTGSARSGNVRAGSAAFGNAAASRNASLGRLGRVGYMPQRDGLMPWRSVLDNAALGLELQGAPKREARRRALELLPAFGLEGTESRRVHELSGGMRQRVSFLRAMLGGGEPLLLDEPFSALDAMTRVAMQEWLLQVWERDRKTVLFITHDVDEALLLSDRVLVAAKAPITALAQVEVGLPRPRSYDAVMDEAFIGLKRRVLSLLGTGAGAAVGTGGRKGGER